MWTYWVIRVYTVLGSPTSKISSQFYINENQIFPARTFNNDCFFE